MPIHISIITAFESLYTPFVSTSLVGRAQEKGIVHIDVQSLFSYVKPKERIDAATFGPGAGMLIKPDVVQKAVEEKEAAHGKAFKIFFSPRGQKLDQSTLAIIARKAQETEHVMLLPARYEGMDSRVEDEYADMIVSVGDLVLMGGDIPAMMLIEGMLRLIPHVVGKEESVRQDSFAGPFVDFPAYTEPVEWKERRVPDVIRSGNHGAIDAWRHDHAVKQTVYEHFEWVRSHVLSEQDKAAVLAAMPPHYVVLMHGEVMVGDERKEGVTSVTSIDIHDIARSSKTYGIKNYFIVTPLQDQQKIVQKILHFWKKGIGFDYNRSRYDAIMQVELVDTLDMVIKQIEEKEGKKPLIVVTSAREAAAKEVIAFNEQAKVWAEQRPVLLVFGTGQGLAPSVIERADFLLVPVEGFTNFNHLSVRSAAAIVLDRWLGVQSKAGKI